MKDKLTSIFLLPCQSFQRIQMPFWHSGDRDRLGKAPLWNCLSASFYLRASCRNTCNHIAFAIYCVAVWAIAHYVVLLCRSVLFLQEALELKIAKKHVFYFSLDRIEDYNQLYELIDCYLRNVRPGKPQRLYILLDEISFVREWQRGVYCRISMV